MIEQPLPNIEDLGSNLAIINLFGILTSSEDVVASVTSGGKLGIVTRPTVDPISFRPKLKDISKRF